MESGEKRVSWSEYLALEGMPDDDRRLDYSFGVVVAQGAPSQDHETIVASRDAGELVDYVAESRRTVGANGAFQSKKGSHADR